MPLIPQAHNEKLTIGAPVPLHLPSAVNDNPNYRLTWLLMARHFAAIELQENVS